MAGLNLALGRFSVAKMVISWNNWFETRPYLPAKAMYPSLPNPKNPHVAVLVDLFERPVEAGVELREIPRRIHNHPSFPRKNVTPYHDTGRESNPLSRSRERARACPVAERG